MENVRINGVTYYQTYNDTWTSLDELHQQTYTTTELQMLEVLSFMQREDRNGQWLEWYEEILEGESEFDKAYIIKTLENWSNELNGDKPYNDSTFNFKYANVIEKVDAIEV